MARWHLSALLAICCAGATASTAPAGPRTVNVASDFFTYHGRCSSKGPAERARQWQVLLEDRHPAFFSQVIYRNQQGKARERYRAWCIERFWSDVAPRMASIRRLGTGIEREIAAIVGRFQKQFPDFRPTRTFYVTVSFSFRGKVAELDGKPVLALGLDQLTAGATQLRITMAHELFHLYHFQTFSVKGGLYRSLWAEGLATYVSAMIVPGHRFSAYLGFPGWKMNRCEKLLARMAAELKQQLGSIDQRIKRIYFGAEPRGGTARGPW